MRVAYRIILIPEESEPYKLTVYMPDFDTYTKADSIADAIYMARDAIGLAGITMQNDGDKVPEPGAAKRENINFSRTLEEALLSKLETESK